MRPSETVTISLTAENAERLRRLAAREDKDMQTMLGVAVEEFLDLWEEYYRTLDILDANGDGQVRVSLTDEG